MARITPAERDSPRAKPRGSLGFPPRALSSKRFARKFMLRLAYHTSPKHSEGLAGIRASVHFQTVAQSPRDSFARARAR